MFKEISKNMNKNKITRRKFLGLSSMAAAGVLTGCAANPVTGQRQLMLVNEDTEIQIDKKNSPMQFSSDYGTIQDNALNSYINRTGLNIAGLTHRPHMPYSFRAVNATYINAYAFPGGSIAITRGILLKIENEAELAALIGHELGHVNARHTAESMSKGVLTRAVVGGIAAYVGSANQGYGNIASQVGMLGAGALLASYSRENEREADRLGLDYMVKAGYSPDGFVGLMDILQSLHKSKPSAIELMFATHPMSDERYNTAVENVRTNYHSTKSSSLYRERYMDNTAKLRSLKGTIEEMQKGEKEMGSKKYDKAESHFQTALKKAPNDYAGLVMMSICQFVQEKYPKAKQYVNKAQKVYPSEAQAQYIGGVINLRLKDFDSAFEDFRNYDRLLPGNPKIIFFKGFSLDGMGNQKQAAEEYYKYLQITTEGDEAKHAYSRLVKWGYLKR